MQGDFDFDFYIDLQAQHSTTNVNLEGGEFTSTAMAYIVRMGVPTHLTAWKNIQLATETRVFGRCFCTCTGSSASPSPE